MAFFIHFVLNMPFITSTNPFCDKTPILPAISWSTMVVRMESNKAHSKANPNWTPANVHTVIVPGPTNAAATNIPGPIFLNIFS